MRAALLAHGTRLAPRERKPFLDIFPTPGAEEPAGGPAAPGEDLLSDIASFVDRLRSGAYYQGWGWDDDLGDERAWGDESWVEEMDDLLGGAGAAFLGGDLDLARESYGRLLDAFRLEDGEVFCGPGSPTEMVATDLTEAKARYLRALYETVPPADRPGRLIEEMEALQHVGEPLSLRALADARREPLDLDSFLPHWIERLKGVPVTEPGFGREAGRLLAEAVELHRGTDGLGDLARESGRPEAFWDWVLALERAGRPSAARVAAVEALERLPPHGEVRARIAEHLAALAAGDGDGEADLSARRKAWRASPSTPRLLALEASARALGKVEEVVAEEADGLDTLWAPTEGDSAWPPARNDRLVVSVLILAGRVDEAADIARRAEPLGWSHRGHPGPVTVPCLLLAAAGRGVPQERDSLLKESWEAIDLDPVISWGEFVGDWLTEEGGDPSGDGQAAPEQDLLPRLSDLLAERIARMSPGPADQLRWLEAGLAVADARVAAVLGGKHRGAYERVACLTVACGEALDLAEEPGAGRFYLDQVRQRYSRYPAFRAKLDAATARSAVAGPVQKADRRPRGKR